MGNNCEIISKEDLTFEYLKLQLWSLSIELIVGNAHREQKSKEISEFLSHSCWRYRSIDAWVCNLRCTANWIYGNKLTILASRINNEMKRRKLNYDTNVIIYQNFIQYILILSKIILKYLYQATDY